MNVNMMITGPEYGSTWSDWSREKEDKRELRHDAVLKQVLGPGPHEFSWGDIRPGHDSKGGFSGIVVTYRAETDSPNQRMETSSSA